MQRNKIYTKKFLALEKKLNEIMYQPPAMWFKDEGGFYITKLTPDNVPADPIKMYEFGTLTEKTVYSKKEAEKLAATYKHRAVFV